MYICITYVAPENSPIHDLYNVDIFKSIKGDFFFQQFAKVFLLGDLNSRTSIKPDYIVNDRLINTLDFQTEADTPTPRYSMDRGTNRFGGALLDLCKATNMRIVNDRLFKDHSIGHITCYTHNEESVVDYVVTSLRIFQSISDFQIYNFNEYSKHAPLYLALKTYTKVESQTKNERIFHKWDTGLKDAFFDDRSRDMRLLNRSIPDGISRKCEPDDIISLFSQFITDRANPYFEKHYSQRNESYFCHENRSIPWTTFKIFADVRW